MQDLVSLNVCIFSVFFIMRHHQYDDDDDDDDDDDGGTQKRESFSVKRCESYLGGKVFGLWALGPLAFFCSAFFVAVCGVFLGCLLSARQLCVEAVCDFFFLLLLSLLLFFVTFTRGPPSMGVGARPPFSSTLETTLLAGSN